MENDRDLMRIVFSEEEENGVRLKAAQRISDEECLKHIINSREELSKMDHHNAIRNSEDVRRAAVWKVADHELLRSLAADYHEQWTVRMAALRRLGPEDQDVLEKIAAKPFDPDPREDPDLYYEPGVKAAAVSGLTNKELLRGYLDDCEKETRAEARIALGALGEEDLLKDTAEDWHWPFDIRKRALERITDQEYLYKYVRYYTYIDLEETKLAIAAVKMIRDPARLEDIAMNVDDWRVSGEAAEMLRNAKQEMRDDG